MRGFSDRPAGVHGQFAIALLASPAAGLAQPAAKVPRIGVLGNAEGSSWDSFRRGLRDLGYVEGESIADRVAPRRWQDRAAS